MRIIAGQFKGRILAAPKGTNTRPTTDRVREALMSAITSARGGFEGACVLDAFGGSGALGLEAISRGAASVCFYENNTATARVLEANIATLKLPATVARINRCDIGKHPPRGQVPPFDLVFLDPPYAMDATTVFSLLANLDQAGALAPDVLISYEHNKSDKMAVDSSGCLLDIPLQLSVVSHKTYGDSAIDLLRKDRA